MSTIVDSVQPVIDSAMENNNDKATILLEPFYLFLHNRIGLFANELAEADHDDGHQTNRHQGVDGDEC